MNRRLELLNLVGVLGLAVLCVLQWQRDRRLNLDVNQLETTRQAQQQNISKQQETTRGLSDDLARLKDQFKAEHEELENTRRTLRAAESLAARLTTECAQLRESMTNWADAVKQRDALVKVANSRIQQLSADLNNSIRKFNELTENYNAVVKEVNESRTKTPVSNNP